MKELNDLMEFGHVVRSDGVGNVTDEGIPDEVKFYVSEVVYADADGDGNLIRDWGVGDDFHVDTQGMESDGWTLLRGFTGQYGYSGAIMDPSEVIGGGLEGYIRQNPGYYVALVVDVMPDDDDAESESAGWAVAYRPLEDGPTHFCTYCDHYSRVSWSGKRVPGSTVYMGTRKQVMAHANIHPVGAPADMALPLSERAPYAED